MNSPDLKKLITGFLLLAVATTSSALIFLAPKAKPVTQRVEGNKPGIIIPKSAFVENIPNPTSRNDASEGGQKASDPSNLTDALAKAIGSQLVNLNPTGPNGDGGLVAVRTPRIDSIMDSFATQSLNPASIKDPAANITEKNFNIIKNPSVNDIQLYQKTIEEVSKKHLSTGAAIEETIYPIETTGSIHSEFALAMKRLREIGVPEQFASSHLSFFKMLTYVHASANLNLQNNDPLTDYLTIQLNIERAEAAGLVALDSLGKIPLPTPTTYNIETDNRSLLIQKLIPRAYATIPVVDPAVVAAIVAHGTATNAVNITTRVLTFLKKVALEYLKNEIVSKLIKQTIQWIQGGGKPQFIQDWKKFLADGANVAVGNALNDISPKLCQSFGPLITIALQPVNPSADPPVQCTLDQVVRNVKDFMDSFKNGGWIAFGAITNPNNNIFGSIIQVNEILMQKKAEAEEAKKNESTSSGGWKSTEICVKERTVNKWKDCMDYGPGSDGDTSACSDPIKYPNKNEKVCDKYDVTTPGAALGNQIYNSLGAPLQQLVNAEDLTALVGAVINFAINKLMKLATGPGTKSGVNKGLAGLDVNGATTPPPGEDPTASCNGITDPAAKTLCIQQVCQGLPEPKPAACAGVESKCGPNPRSCLCDGDPGGPTSFSYQSAVADAQARLVAQCTAATCTFLTITDGKQTTSDEAGYVSALAAEITAGPPSGLTGVAAGDEVGVRGVTAQYFDVVTSNGDIWLKGIAVCTDPND